MRNVWGLLVGASLAASCIQPETVLCDGRICPVDFVCVDIPGPMSGEQCVSPSQVRNCEGLAQLAACDFLVDGDQSGVCNEGVCYPARCGDGARTLDELCDDGNAIDGDNCSADCMSTEICGNGIVDVAVDESCDDENYLSGDGCSSTCLAEVASWHEVELDNFPGQQGGEMAYDAARRVTVLYGGLSPSLSPARETLEYDGRQWIRVNRGVLPPGRDGHVLAYVPEAGGIVLFGGAMQGMMMQSPPLLDETWLYDGAWRQLAPTTKPSPRGGAAGAYDAARGELVVFGGESAQGVLADTWVFAGGTWTQRLVTGPAARRNHRMAYDSNRQRVVLVGGTAADATTTTWEWNGTTWSSRAGAPSQAPGAIAFDSVRGHIVTYGGYGTPSQATWLYDGTSWEPVAGDHPGGAMGRSRPAMTFDANIGAVVMRGGTARMAGQPGPPFEDTWHFTTGWDEDTESDGRAPSERNFAGFAYDSRSARFVLAGGYLPFGGIQRADTWTFDGFQWVERELAGPIDTCEHDTPDLRPDQPCTARAVDDVAHGRLLLVRTTHAELEVFVWGGIDGTWQSLGTTGSPPPRKDFGLVYDAARGVVVLYGGETIVNDMPMGPRGDTWELDGSTWRQVTVPAAPPPRAEPALAFDGTHVILFGGRGGPMTALDDTWEYDGVAWTPRLVEDRPGARRGAAMAFHQARGRVILFGGDSMTAPYDDTWELADEGWVQLAAFEGPLPRKSPHLAYDPDRKLLVLHGGDPTTDTWELVFRSSLTDEVCDGGLDEDTDGFADCLDEDCDQSLCNLGTGLCRDTVCVPL